MTSWTIVSSRCVFGSSNGIRLFSASRTINKLVITATSAAPAVAPLPTTPRPSKVDNENVPNALSSAKHPRRRGAEHGSLAQELEEVVVGLQPRRADAAGDERLRLVDDAEQERRQRDDEYDVDEEVDVDHVISTTATRRASRGCTRGRSGCCRFGTDVGGSPRDRSDRTADARRGRGRRRGRGSRRMRPMATGP